MQRQGVWLVVALLLGLGLGYLLGKSAAPGAPSPGLAGGAEPPVPPEDEPGPELHVARAPSAEPVRGTPANVVEGSGVISGSVKDAAGAPVRDVVVIARPYFPDPAYVPRPGAPPPPERTPEDVARGAAAKARDETLASRRASTGSDGRYRLERLGPGPFQVLAYKQGHRLRALGDGRGWQIRPDAVVNFSAEAVSVLHVELVVPAGGPLEKVMIVAHGVAGSRSQGGVPWSKERSWLELAPGRYEVQAKAGGLQSARVPVVLEHGEPAQVRLVLGGRPGIAGAIRIAEPLDRQRPTVHALLVEGEDPPTAADLFGRGRGRRRLRPTRADVGRGGTSYVFDDLAPGRWLIGLSLDRRTCAAHAEILVRDEREVHDFELPPFDRDIWLRVRVLNAAGELARGLSVGHGFEAPGWSIGGAWGLPLADGTYLVARAVELPGPAAGRELPEGGTHWLRISSRAHGKRRIEFDPRRRGDLEVRLADATAPKLLVVGADRLRPGTKVGFAKKLANVGIGLVQQQYDVPASGEVQLQAMQPGPWYAVFLWHASVADPKRGPVRGEAAAMQIAVPVELVHGRAEVRVDVPTLHRLTVRGAQGRGFSLVQLVADGEMTSQIVHGDDTSHVDVVLTHVPPGRYEVAVYDRATRTKARYPITISAGDAALDLATAKPR